METPAWKRLLVLGAILLVGGVLMWSQTVNAGMGLVMAGLGAVMVAAGLVGYAVRG